MRQVVGVNPYCRGKGLELCHLLSKLPPLLLAANDVVFFTGAGISAESGISTYGEKLTGIWAGHDPRDLETAKAYRDNPTLVAPSLSLGLGAGK